MTAEKVKVQLSEWLGISPLRVSDVDIYLSGSAAEFSCMHQHLSIPPLSGYYEDLQLVILEPVATQAVDWIIAHEIAHVVCSEYELRLSTALSEGFAEVVADWTTNSTDEGVAFEIGGEGRDAYRFTTWLEKDRGRLPSLRELIMTPNAKFQKTRRKSYAVSWSLVKYLISSDHPEVRGRFQSLLARMGQDSDPWTTFCAVYDERLVEHHWLLSIDEWPRAMGSEQPRREGPSVSGV